MKKTAAVLLMTIAFLFPHASGAGDDSADMERLLRENAFIEAELKLASKPGIYYVLEPSSRRIYIKSRGMALKEIQSPDMRVWGGPLKTGPHALEKSTSKPERRTIKPGEGNVVNSTASEFLDIADMPSSYTLVYNGGMSISVSPTGGGLAGRIANIPVSIFWRLTRPFIALWYKARGLDPVFVRAAVSPEDSRALYWSAQPMGLWLVSPR